MLIPLTTDHSSGDLPFMTIALIALCTFLQLRASMGPSYEEQITKYCQSSVGIETSELLLEAGLKKAGLLEDQCVNSVVAIWEGRAASLTSSPKLSVEDKIRLRQLLKRSERQVDLWGYRAFQPRKFNVLTMFTSALNHGGWMHLLGNMLFLWLFGSVLEGIVGPMALLAIFFGSSAVADAVYGLLAMIGLIEGLPTLGASAGVYGIMAAVWRKVPRLKVNVFVFMISFFRIVPVPATWLIGFYVLCDAAGLIFQTSAGVNLIGHLTAFAFIFILLEQTRAEREYSLSYEAHRYDVTPSKIE